MNFAVTPAFFATQFFHCWLLADRSLRGTLLIHRCTFAIFFRWSACLLSRVARSAVSILEHCLEQYRFRSYRFALRKYFKHLSQVL